LSYKTNQLVSKIQEEVFSKKSKIVLTNTSQKLLMGLLKHECNDVENMKDKYLVLQYLSDNIQKADAI
jgi:hypothetical protein